MGISIAQRKPCVTMLTFKGLLVLAAVSCVVSLDASLPEAEGFAEAYAWDSEEDESLLQDEEATSTAAKVADRIPAAKMPHLSRLGDMLEKGPLGDMLEKGPLQLTNHPKHFVQTKHGNEAKHFKKKMKKALA